MRELECRRSTSAAPLHKPDAASSASTAAASRSRAPASFHSGQRDSSVRSRFSSSLPVASVSRYRPAPSGGGAGVQLRAWRRQQRAALAVRRARAYLVHAAACAGSRQRQGAAGDGGAAGDAAAGAESLPVEGAACACGGGADTASSSSSSQSALSSASEMVGYATLSGFSERQPGGGGTAWLRRPTATSIALAPPLRRVCGSAESGPRRAEEEARSGVTQAGPTCRRWHASAHRSRASAMAQTALDDKTVECTDAECRLKMRRVVVCLRAPARHGRRRHLFGCAGVAARLHSRL